MPATQCVQCCLRGSTAGEKEDWVSLGARKEAGVSMQGGYDSTLHKPSLTERRLKPTMPRGLPVVLVVVVVATARERESSTSPPPSCGHHQPRPAAQAWRTCCRRSRKLTRQQTASSIQPIPSCFGLGRVSHVAGFGGRRQPARQGGRRSGCVS